MADQCGEVSPRAQLLDVVRQVRRRWRIKLALKGAVGFVVAGLLAILAVAYALETLKFAPSAIFWFRIATGIALVGAAAWFFARPLTRKVTDEQVALYLEEHEPSLDSAIVSAMEAAEKPGDWSPELSRRLVEKAIERVHEIHEGAAHRARAPCAATAWIVGGVAVATIALFTFGPGYLRHTLSAIFVHLSRRRGRGPVPHRRDARATPRCPRAPTRPSTPRSPASTPPRR